MSESASRQPVRTAVVTGASRGIGFAIAQAFVREGMRVAMLARGVEALESAATELGDLALPIPCDVSDEGDVASAVTTIHGVCGGPPEIVVSNAGMFFLERVEDTPAAQFRAAIDVNLVAPFLLARAFVPSMRAAGRGHLVTIGSFADRIAFPENGAYAATKFGARALHEVLRLELRGSGVRTTLVSPSSVDTQLWDPLDPDSRAGFTPRSKMLSPEAVAEAVRYAVMQPAAVNIDELRLSHS